MISMSRELMQHASGIKKSKNVKLGKPEKNITMDGKPESRKRFSIRRDPNNPFAKKREADRAKKRAASRLDF